MSWQSIRDYEDFRHMIDVLRRTHLTEYLRGRDPGGRGLFGAKYRLMSVTGQRNCAERAPKTQESLFGPDGSRA